MAICNRVNLSIWQILNLLWLISYAVVLLMAKYCQSNLGSRQVTLSLYHPSSHGQVPIVIKVCLYAKDMLLHSRWNYSTYVIIFQIKNSLEVAFIFCKSDLGQKLFNLKEDCFFSKTIYSFLITGYKTKQYFTFNKC